jgi:hypothetical protein
MIFSNAKNIRLMLFAALSLCAGVASAEPYLAVREGFKCAQCHVNPTGGGLRNVFGNAYVQSQLAANRIDTGDTVWTGAVGQMLAVGGDLRADAAVVDVPNQEQTRAFEVQQARVYMNVAVIPNRLNFYVDELVAPGVASNREAYVRYQSGGGSWSIKAGKMYLPFGLRLQDDLAFVRQVSSINMTTPDSGVEISWDPESWSSQLAISNGSAGAPEDNKGKQVSLQTAFVQRSWRIGVAANHNDSDDGDRSAVGLFAGLRTGPIAWLAEVDYVEDEGFSPDKRKLIAGLLEGNWLIQKGHNLKLTAEHFDPDNDIDEDEQARFSAVYEYTPIQYLQIRGGVRYYDGIPQNDLQNRREGFLELHGFF